MLLDSVVQQFIVPSDMASLAADDLLNVDGVTVTIASPAGPLVAIDRASFTLPAGRTLCLVGESGCGKSLTCLAIMGLLPPRVKLAGGTINLAGQTLTELAPQEMTQVRGRDIAMIYQDPTAALNPVLTIGRQVAEVLVLRAGMGWDAARLEARRLLDRVGIPDAARRMGDYPHQLSGGMNQRVTIAMALACRPRLLIADEPTTALDVTIQAQILDLLRDLQDEFGTAILLVTHDLGVVAEIGHRVAVMYSGRIVEEGAVEKLFTRPAHPYTQGLLACLPRIDGEIARLATIDGIVPAIDRLPPGCHYAPRCDRALDLCSLRMPHRITSAERSVQCNQPIA